MKTQKLLVIVAISCLMLGVSGAAMAQDSNCPAGAVTGLVDGDLTVRGDCVVQGAVITGDVRVNNAVENSFVLRDTTVNGQVIVRGGSVIITRTVVVSSNLRVKDTIDTVVENTLVAVGNMRFVGNQQVLIYSNTVPVGDIRCKDNINPDDLLIGEYATQNIVPTGVVTCFGQ